MTTTERLPLTRERIIEAAVAFADEHGIDDLSMRKLGAELGVEAMSLYNHVDNKDDIYDGMINYVFESIEMPSEGVDWRTGIRDICASTMEILWTHSWAVITLMQRGNFGPSALSFMNEVVGRLRNAGLNDEDIHHGWQMLASHTMGYASQAATNPGVMEQKLSNLQAMMAENEERYPHVAALGPLLSECQWDREYMFGLEIILDGLEARLN